MYVDFFLFNVFTRAAIIFGFFFIHSFDLFECMAIRRYGFGFGFRYDENKKILMMMMLNELHKYILIIIMFNILKNEHNFLLFSVCMECVG